MAQSTYTLTLNGSNSLSWSNSKANGSDSSERSGLSGFTEWVVFQWPTSALKAQGADNVITINVSGTSNAETEGGKVRPWLTTATMPFVSNSRTPPRLRPRAAGTTTSS